MLKMSGCFSGSIGTSLKALESLLCLGMGKGEWEEMLE
jgi:hypothetical protein